MARLVVLRFEDDEQATEFVEVNRVIIPHKSHYANATVEGMFQTPTKFCDCPYRGDGWRRSEKHGWWLHFGCGRPSIGWSENIRAVISEGHDLLERVSKKNTEERRNATPYFVPESGDVRGPKNGNYGSLPAS